MSEKGGEYEVALFDDRASDIDGPEEFGKLSDAVNWLARNGFTMHGDIIWGRYEGQDCGALIWYYGSTVPATEIAVIWPREVSQR